MSTFFVFVFVVLFLIYFFILFYLCIYLFIYLSFIFSISYFFIVFFSWCNLNISTEGNAKRCTPDKKWKLGLQLSVIKLNQLLVTWNHGWLVGWVLWYINLRRLFNAKSIFMKIILFQTIRFRISTQFKCKYSLIVKNISISSYSV